MVAGRQVLIFSNPRAGRGYGERLVHELSQQLQSRGYEVAKVDDIDRLKDALLDVKSELVAIVSAGGDGTAETVVNVTDELSSQSSGWPMRRVPIAVLPLGTENLLAKYLGIRPDPCQIADLIQDGYTLRLDAGRANGKLFLLMLSCGFDADVVRRLHQERSGNISHFAYAAPMWEALRHYDYPQLVASWETPSGWEERECHWAFCFNAPSYAAGLRIVRDADPADGLLDLATFAGGSLWHGLWQFGGVVLGQHFQMPEFEHRRTGRIRIRSEQDNVPFQVDGDPGGVLPVEIEVLPSHFTLIAVRGGTTGPRS